MGAELLLNDQHRFTLAARLRHFLLHAIIPAAMKSFKKIPRRFGTLALAVLIVTGTVTAVVWVSPTAEPGRSSEAKQSRSPYAGACQADGVQYRRQHSAADLAALFGVPRSPELTSQLVKTTLLGRPVTVHRKVAACLDAVERERIAKGIEYVVDLTDPLGSLGGYRPADSQLGDASYHAYGASIDINPSQNPHCRSRGAVDPLKRCGLDKPYTVPDELVAVFKSHGFTWGGNWWRNKDYMHFEWHGEVPA